MSIDFDKYPFPKKIRHHANPQVYLPKRELSRIPRGYPPLYVSLDWSGIFANGRYPDCLDIGCGKGVFMLEYALQRPELNILGIEVRKVIAEWLIGVISSEGLPNAAALWYSVANGLGFIESGSIEKIFYFFPDPWYKRRHHKRRVLGNEFLDEVRRILKPGGEMLIQTDVPDVHQYHLWLLSKRQDFVCRELSMNEDWSYPPTNKEMFCLEKGIEYFRISSSV